jgi:hypothetical protein
MTNMIINAINDSNNNNPSPPITGLTIPPNASQAAKVLTSEQNV